MIFTVSILPNNTPATGMKKRAANTSSARTTKARKYNDTNKTVARKPVKTGRSSTSRRKAVRLTAVWEAMTAMTAIHSTLTHSLSH